MLVITASSFKNSLQSEPPYLPPRNPQSDSTNLGSAVAETLTAKDIQVKSFVPFSESLNFSLQMSQA